MELDKNGLFSDAKLKLRLSFQYFIFILKDESIYKPKYITEYIQGDEFNDTINTVVIDAIKYIKVHEKQYLDMDRYLKTAYAQIKNSDLKTHVKNVYEALQLLTNEHKEIKYEATVLTLQLLHCNDNKQRKQLLTEYTNLASKLHGSRIPKLMCVGICMFLLSATLLTIGLLTGPTLPVSLIILAVGVMLTGIITGIVGKNRFYSDEAKQKRTVANTFFALRDDFDNVSENLIHSKINDNTVSLN